MRVCSSCGYDQAPEEGPCPLCDGPVTATASDDETTLQIDSAELERIQSGWRPKHQPDEVFAERYVIEAHVGRGGMGDVYRVQDRNTGATAALKVMLPSTLESPGAVERFKREIAMLAKFEHPAVPRVLDYGLTGDTFFFVSEFVTGSNLGAVTSDIGPWQVERACHLVAEVADALDVAHELGIVHRDIKSANIMLDDTGGVHLLDFGVARGFGLDMSTITKTGMMVGTPEYMSPEQIDSHRADPRSDIYSLGVVLFELLTGVLPFKADTPVGVAMKHKSEAPPSPREMREDVPVWLEKIVLRCLDKDPSRRYQSASDLAAMLRAPRSDAPPRKRTLRGGDLAIEDEAAVTEWPLVLYSKAEKTGWMEGMALLYGGKHYKLVGVTGPAGSSTRWGYHFAHWPSTEVFRGLVDYERHMDEQLAGERGRRGLLGAFRRS